MSKRLILILALAFVVGITAGAFAEVQNVKVSGDLTVIGARRQLTFGDNNISTFTTERNPRSFLASLLRVRVDADLTDNVMATVRLLNEKYWGTGANSSSGADAFGDDSEMQIDLAYATMKEFLYSPLTLTVGRQELHFGNDMIVGAVNTNNSNGAQTAVGLTSDPDLSLRKSFDAIRATLNYDPLMIDIIGAKVQTNSLTMKDDVNLYGVYATYSIDKKTNISPYWFLRLRQSENSAVTANTATNGKNDQTHVVGALVTTSIIDNLMLSAEGAVQLGKDSTLTPGRAVQRKAFAAELAAIYSMPKVKMTPTITALYAYFSGQHGDSAKKSTAWDPMYENQSYGNIANALFNQSNVALVGGVISAKPMEDVTLKGEYYAYWLDKNYADGQVITDVPNNPLVTTDRKFIGQEVDLTASYDYTEDVQFSLMGGVLNPGAALDKSNRKLANEVIGSMKVTF